MPATTPTSARLPAPTASRPRLDEATVGGHREERVAILDGHARVGAEDAEDAAPSEAAAARALVAAASRERLVDDLKDRDAEAPRLAAASLGGGDASPPGMRGTASACTGVGRSQPCSSAVNELGAHPELLEHRHVERDEAAGATAREREWRKRSGRRPRRRDHEILLLVFHVL